MAMKFCIPRTECTVQRHGSVTITSSTVVTGIHAYDVVTVNKQFQFSYLKTSTGEVCSLYTGVTLKVRGLRVNKSKMLRLVALVGLGNRQAECCQFRHCIDGEVPCSRRETTEGPCVRYLSVCVRAFVCVCVRARARVVRVHNFHLFKCKFAVVVSCNNSFGMANCRRHCERNVGG
jgi:hypothetical protein